MNSNSNSNSIIEAEVSEELESKLNKSDLVTKNLKNLPLTNTDDNFCDNWYIELVDLDIKNIGHVEGLRLMLHKKITSILTKDDIFPKANSHKNFDSFGHMVPNN
jgi:hypothetical protein